MTFRINLNWTASINKIVEIEAGTEEEARERAIGSCVEHVLYRRNAPSEESSMETSKEDRMILPDNPDSAEYFLEEELCEVISQ